MKTQPPQKVHDLPLVEVVWVDATLRTDHEGSLNDPNSTKAFGSLATYTDIGYLVRKTRREVVLACSICAEDDTFRHANTVPRKWVKEIIYLSRQKESQTDGKAPNDS